MMAPTVIRGLDRWLQTRDLVLDDFREKTSYSTCRDKQIAAKRVVQASETGTVSVSLCFRGQRSLPLKTAGSASHTSLPFHS